MCAIASQITSLTIVYSTVYSGANERKHESSTSRAFVWGVHRSSVNSPHKWPVTRKTFPFDDVIIVFRWTVADLPWWLPPGSFNCDLCKSYYTMYISNYSPMNTFVHPCSKVIGMYFVMSNEGIYFQCIDLKFFVLHYEVFCIYHGKYHECLL